MAVLECKNLKKTDTFGSTDGYVEVSLLPHKEKMDKTKTIKSSANPVWNQTFTYQVNIGSFNCSAPHIPRSVFRLPGMRL